MPISEFREAQERYARIRRSVYDAVQDLVSREWALPAAVHLTDIDGYALETRRLTWTFPHWSGSGGWDWDALVRPVLRRPSGLPLAVWSGDQLLGLAIGRASKRRAWGRHHTLSIHFVETHPDPRHPLRSHILEIVFEAAEQYGRALGAERLRLVAPLPALMPLYLRTRFEIAGRHGHALYLERAIIGRAPEDRNHP
ncbi:MAG TPA: hypothetical protein VGB66_09755 [Longimicrobium sp.]